MPHKPEWQLYHSQNNLGTPTHEHFLSVSLASKRGSDLRDLHVSEYIVMEHVTPPSRKSANPAGINNQIDNFTSASSS